MNVMLLVMSTKRLMDGTRDQENIIIDEHRQHSLNKNNPNDVHYLSIMFIFQHFVFREAFNKKNHFLIDIRQ